MATLLLIVSDVRLYREGMVRILENQPSVETVGTAATISHALESVEKLRPEVALVDIAMRESLSAIKRLAVDCNGLKVLALAVSEFDEEIIACAEAGISGYVTREASVEELVRSIEAARAGELPCSPKIAASLLRRVSTLARASWETEPLENLTPREMGILRELEKGLSNKLIARELQIEVATVKNHVHNIFEKLKVHSRAEAVARFLGIR